MPWSFWNSNACACVCSLPRSRGRVGVGAAPAASRPDSPPSPTLPPWTGEGGSAAGEGSNAPAIRWIAAIVCALWVANIG
ncbi:hypothetical protein E2F46_16320 [Luteimonas aestuarii]|uniref:Uncharacterized protein n=1 Tax=Luteimonas aestuarii TaxID=453837 RepID=A0A4R5TQL3_9GAMM|nr:hypothetical protein E2F46_16320 [Luteimonas aestuarii]